MTSVESIAAALESVPEKKENLRRAFEVLQSHSSSFSAFTLRWNDIESHFNEMEKLITKRMEGLKSNGQKQPLQAGVVSELSDKTSKAVSSKEQKMKQSAVESKPLDKRIKDLKSKQRQQDPQASVESKPLVTENSRDKYMLIKTEPKSIKMDKNRLQSLILQNSVDVGKTRPEVCEVLRSSSDGAELVLDLIESFEDWLVNGFLLDCLMSILPAIKAPVRERAMKLADKWKGKIEASVGGRKATAFLRLLAVYGLASAFKADELLDLVVFTSRRKHSIRLCQILGLEHKIPEFVQKLISKGKQVAALKFVRAFNLEEKFPPASLLEGYLKEWQKVANEILEKGNNSIKSQKVANEHELSSLRAVIKSIEEHRLESEYPREKLDKRLAELEMKAERISTEVTEGAHKPSQKRPRPAGATATRKYRPLPKPAGHHLSVGQVAPYIGSSIGSYGFVGSAEGLPTLFNDMGLGHLGTSSDLGRSYPLVPHTYSTELWSKSYDHPTGLPPTYCPPF